MPERAVIDASAAVDVLQRSARSERVQEAIQGFDLIAPGHIDVEVLSALHRAVRAGLDTPVQMVARLSLWQGWSIVRVPLNSLLRGATALLDSVSVPDALYIELAEQEGVPLITCDRGMAAATSRAVLVS